MRHFSDAHGTMEMEELYIVFGVQDVSTCVLPIQQSVNVHNSKYYNGPLNSYASMWYNISIVKIQSGLFAKNTYSPSCLMQDINLKYETACVNHNGRCVLERGKFYMGWCTCKKLYDNSILLVSTSVGKLVSVDLRQDSIKICNRLQRNPRFEFDKNNSEVLISFRTQSSPKDLLIDNDPLVSITPESVSIDPCDLMDFNHRGEQTDENEDAVFEKMKEGYYFTQSVLLDQA